MEARREDVAGLINLQNIDLELMRARKQFDELPQRKAIAELRKKRETVEGKRDAVAALKKDARARLSRINDEDASLEKKAAGVQAAIEAAGGDYRNVEARTKELAGIAKRRATLEVERAKEAAELEKIDGIEAQVAQMLEQIARKESAEVASFQKEGGALRASIAELEQQRAGIAAEVAPAVVQRYEKIAAHTGGVAVGVLNGAQCGVCRATVEPGRLIDLKAQAPLGTCPACKRLLIIG